MSIVCDRFIVIDKPIKKDHIVKVRDKLYDRVVWLKYAPASNKNIQKEYEAINRIDSEFIVEAIEYSCSEGNNFLILEDAGTVNLQKKLRNKQSKDTLFALSKQVASAFCSMEHAGVHYRDLMDDHIIVGANNDIKLIDFNNVLFIESDLTYINRTTSGFYKTMAPEEHIADSRLKNSNIYSLCCLIYRMFNGHYPIDHLSAKHKALSSVLCCEDFKTLNKSLPNSKLLSKKQNSILMQGLNYDEKFRLKDAVTFLKEFFDEEFEHPVRNDFCYWMVDESIGVTHRPGFYSKRIFRKNAANEINDFYLKMGKEFPVCLCLLTKEEKDCFCSKEVYKQFGRKHFNRYIEYELSSSPSYNEELKAILNELYESLRNEQKVLIHCNAGVGRACTIAICLRIKCKAESGENISVESLIKQVSEKRSFDVIIENDKQLELINECFKDTHKNKQRS